MKQTMTVNVETEDIKILRSHPWKKSVGVSGLIRMAIREFLERQESKKVERKNKNQSET